MVIVITIVCFNIFFRMNFNPLHDRFYEVFNELVLTQGGYFNAHSHIDRANTFNFNGLSGNLGSKGFTISLTQKQSTTGELHKSDYYKEASLRSRMSQVLDDSIFYGVSRLDSFIDSTADIGLRAFEVALELRDEYRDRIDFRVGSYPIFGFKDDEPKRLEVFLEASQMADFIGGLPERDLLPGHVGYERHVRNLIQASLACDKPKPVHIHVDQGNIPSERGAWKVIEGLKWLDFPKEINGQPSVYLVHMLSPSCYGEKEFVNLIHALKEYNIGVIVCPNAALSMRQRREFNAPIHNSVARVLELLLADVPVRVGSDNICDIFIPSGSPNLFLEVNALLHSVRCYDLNVFSALASLSSKKLSHTQKLNVFDSLDDFVKPYYQVFIA